MEGIGASTAYDLQYRAFAKKWGLAVVSPDIFPKEGRSCRDWIDTETGSGPALIRALREVAAASGHGELQTAPWLLWGHSGGGYWTLSMMKNYPGRIIAVFAYSPAFDPQWEYPDSAYQIPLLIRHAGAADLNGRNVACWQTALNTFDKFRKRNGHASLAYTPGQNHNFSYVRYMAIPFYESVLSQRLPAGHSAKLREMDQSKAWLGDTLTYTVYKSDSFAGDKSDMNWFPDSLTAVKWREYVITGTVADKIPPPAPYDLKVQPLNDTAVTLTWKADADIESGIQYFTIRVKDGETQRFPASGDYQTFDTNGDNTAPLAVPDLKCEIAKLPDKKETVIFVSAVNHFGLESPYALIRYGY
jgi:pimeloyl-ACP methyl ester carboxylesterase